VNGSQSLALTKGGDAPRNVADSDTNEQSVCQLMKEAANRGGPHFAESSGD
jgi:hypothetical protein